MQADNQPSPESGLITLQSNEIITHLNFFSQGYDVIFVQLNYPIDVDLPWRVRGQRLSIRVEVEGVEISFLA